MIEVVEIRYSSIIISSSIGWAIRSPAEEDQREYLVVHILLLEFYSGDDVQQADKNGKGQG